MIWTIGIASALCLAAMAAIVVLDEATRIIPRELCWALAAAGALLQICIGGVANVVVGMVWGMAVCSVAVVSRWLVDRRRSDGRSSLGGGDVRCMAALSLATGPGAPVGFAACFAAASLWAVIARTRGRLKTGEAFAFAPFLALWLMVGVLVVI